jgi:hypothetical protein
MLDSKTGAGFVLLAAIANASFALPKKVGVHRLRHRRTALIMKLAIQAWPICREFDAR